MVRSSRVTIMNRKKMQAEMKISYLNIMPKLPESFTYYE